MKRKGFTLIELLIVVAIIAILAAIAVPNFLESQTRAKVSRVMADMRSIATAIEAYTVDYNRPPLDWYEWSEAETRGVVLTLDFNSVLAQLTTPVAYLTSIPEDFFVPIREGLSLHSWYATLKGYGWPGGTYHSDPSDPAALFYGPRVQYQWVLVSWGPDMYLEYFRYGSGWHGDVLYYDATNGSKSQGDIYYYGPGGGFNPAPAPSR